MEMTIELLQQFYSASTENMKINFEFKIKLAQELKHKKTCKRDTYRAMANSNGHMTYRNVENIANSEHFKENFMQKKTLTD